nr:MAG TPA: hypothetical protein [Caudoviricetes sp.]DAL20059.1 MAG TPA_asm: hypothetical protein [Caudoviricetes sp.]
MAALPTKSIRSSQTENTFIIPKNKIVLVK